MRYAILFLMFATPANAQNAMGSHPDTRPDRDHSGTLSFDAHQRKLASCMVEISTIADPDLRRWCLVQSKRLP